MRYLRQSTATAVLVGPFLDATDGKTPETALTVASIDVDLYKFSDAHPLTKTDITPSASGGANDMAHVANGYYSLELTAANVDTLGRVTLSANIADALPLAHEFHVLPANVYDSFFGADKLTVDVGELSSTVATDISTIKTDARRAAAAVANKTTNDQATGRKTVYDNDGVTELFRKDVTASGVSHAVLTETPV